MKQSFLLIQNSPGTRCWLILAYPVDLSSKRRVRIHCTPFCAAPQPHPLNRSALGPPSADTMVRNECAPYASTRSVKR